MIREHVLEWKEELTKEWYPEKEYEKMVNEQFSDENDRILAWALWFNKMVDDTDIANARVTAEGLETILAGGDVRDSLAEFRLHYYCRNGGDGSVSVKPTASADEAEKRDADLDEGWGESSADYFTVVAHKGKLYVKERGSLWNPIKREHLYFNQYIPLEKMKKAKK